MVSVPSPHLTSPHQYETIALNYFACGGFWEGWLEPLLNFIVFSNLRAGLAGALRGFLPCAAIAVAATPAARRGALASNALVTQIGQTIIVRRFHKLDLKSSYR